MVENRTEVILSHKSLREYIRLLYFLVTFTTLPTLNRQSNSVHISINAYDSISGNLFSFICNPESIISCKGTTLTFLSKIWIRCGTIINDLYLHMILSSISLKFSMRLFIKCLLPKIINKTVKLLLYLQWLLMS